MRIKLLSALAVLLLSLLTVSTAAFGTEPNLSGRWTCVSPTEALVAVTVTSGGAAGVITGVWGWPAADPRAAVGTVVSADFVLIVEGRATPGVLHRNGLQIDYGSDKGNRATHLDVLVPAEACAVSETTTTSTVAPTTTPALTTSTVAPTTTEAPEVTTTTTTTVYLPGATTTALGTSVTTGPAAQRLPATGAGSVWGMTALAAALVVLGLGLRKWSSSRPV